MHSSLPPARVLIVDDETMIRELLCSYLSDHGYVCHACGSVDEALSFLASEPADVVVSDFNMPGATGLDLLTVIAERYPRLDFLMATAAPDTKVAVAAMKLGAADFLLKPLDLKRVLQAVHDAVARRRDADAAEHRRQQLEKLLQQRTDELGMALRQIQQASHETLQALAMALDLRAQDVAGHSLRVSRYGVELAARLGYSSEALERFENASYLHDIGKLAIPDAILNKPGALTADELEVMRSHVQIGFDLVTQVQSLAHAAELVLAHQERYDGTGYPRGLAGEAIPHEARIFAVADALDAMTSDRPYRRALEWEEAHAEILRQSGHQFDPRVVEAFAAIPRQRWQELQAATPRARTAVAG